MRTRPVLAAVLTSLLGLTSLVACGSDAGGTGEGGGSRVTLHVFAAASLTEAFTTLGKQFEKDHPGTEVELNFGPSSGLAEQITGGAPADVFASASHSNMDTLTQSGDASDPKDFAENSGEIAVPPDNPAGITSVADLGKPGVKVAVCQAQVPCGKVATDVFANSEVSVKPATEEVDVKSVLTKVTLGEVDAGLVYVTDVKAAGDKVKGIEIPDDQNSITSYPIAALKDSEHQKEADEFVDLVLSGAGAKVLTQAGFAQP
jgi:molybdate transport system substrate-binding protein